MFIRKVLNKFDYIHVKNFSPNIIIYLYWHNYGEAILQMYRRIKIANLTNKEKIYRKKIKHLLCSLQPEPNYESFILSIMRIFSKITFKTLRKAIKNQYLCFIKYHNVLKSLFCKGVSKHN
jgi:hypothetical protein